MEPFLTVTEHAVPLPRANIDTDAIIPVIFMRGATKDVSHGLFGLWRKDATGHDRSEFTLNQPRYRNAGILVAGPNFGCGSSREAAVWALTYSGYRCVIAPSFGDIFYENALRNGLLPAIVEEQAVDRLNDHLQEAIDPTLTIDLPDQRIYWAGGPDIRFTIPEIRKQALMAGQDEIGITLQRAGDLARYREQDQMARPWIYERGR